MLDDLIKDRYGNNDDAPLVADTAETSGGEWHAQSSPSAHAM